MAGLVELEEDDDLDSFLVQQLVGRGLIYENTSGTGGADWNQHAVNFTVMFEITKMGRRFLSYLCEIAQPTVDRSVISASQIRA